MDVKFNNLKELRQEIIALKKDKANINSKSIGELVDKQIEEVERVLALREEQLGCLSFELLDKKKEFEVFIREVSMDRDISDGGCYIRPKVKITIDYIVQFKLPKEKVIEGKIEIDRIDFYPQENLFQAAHRIATELFE